MTLVPTSSVDAAGEDLPDLVGDLTVVDDHMVDTGGPQKVGS